MAAEEFAEDTDWQTKLRYMPRSKCLENSVWNLMLILNNDPDFANIAFNELVGRVQITGAVPWTRPGDNKFWRDADTAQLKALIDIRYETFSSRNHDVAFTKVVEDRHFNPLREWLDALPEWDGVTRLENSILISGANSTGYVKAATRKLCGGVGENLRTWDQVRFCGGACRSRRAAASPPSLPEWGKSTFRQSESLLDTGR